MPPDPASRTRWPSQVHRLGWRRGTGLVTELDIFIAFDPARGDRPVEVAYVAGCRAGADLELLARDLCHALTLLLVNGVELHRIGALSDGEGGVDPALGGSLLQALVAGLAAASELDEADERQPDP